MTGYGLVPDYRQRRDTGYRERQGTTLQRSQVFSYLSNRSHVKGAVRFRHLHDSRRYPPPMLPILRPDFRTQTPSMEDSIYTMHASILRSQHLACLCETGLLLFKPSMSTYPDRITGHILTELITSGRRQPCPFLSVFSTRFQDRPRFPEFKPWVYHVLSNRANMDSTTRPNLCPIMPGPRWFKPGPEVENRHLEGNDFRFLRPRLTYSTETLSSSCSSSSSPSKSRAP